MGVTGRGAENGFAILSLDSPPVWSSKCRENHWKMIPYWDCKKAELRNSKNKVIVSKKDNNLSVFSFSLKVHKTISYNELINHTATDKKRPNSTIFYFRKKCNHWYSFFNCSIHYFSNSIYRISVNTRHRWY